ncbi:MAG: TIGR01440 family protein [Lachnospiraceae bacterium]|nr:TIGR01440 family protein [Lachnospiraceae bacterium]
MTGIKEEAAAVVREVAAQSKLKRGDLLVIGCSTSAVRGELIGTASSMDTAKELADGIMEAVDELGLKLAVQCCEHLNRALVCEREVMEAHGFEQVNVLPQPKAGGSLATTIRGMMKDPVMVLDIKQSALAGIDIGGVLIGMHIMPVAVPLKLRQRTIGEAMVIAARRRPRFVGGGRAVYDEELL